MKRRWWLTLSTAAALGTSGLLLTAASSRDVAKDVWLAMASLESEGSCSPTGMRDIYFDLFVDSDNPIGVPLMSLSYLERLSGTKIWKKNSHIMDEPVDDFTYVDSGQVGHYNPRFVDWAFSTFLPARHDSRFREKTQSRYTCTVMPYARNAWVNLMRIESNPSCRDQLIQTFKQSTDPDRSAPTGYDWEADCWQGKEGTSFDDGTQLHLLLHPDDQENGLVGTGPPDEYMIAFWLRREIDGSRPNFKAGLKRLLQVYDAGWLASYGKPAAKLKGIPDPEALTDAQFLAAQKSIDEARLRLQGPAAAEAKRAREASIKTALDTCRKFQSEVSKRKDEVRQFAAEGRMGTAEGAAHDLQQWIQSQQRDSDGMGAALETLRDRMEEMDDLIGSGMLTMEDKIRFVQQVQAACGG